MRTGNPQQGGGGASGNAVFPRALPFLSRTRPPPPFPQPHCGLRKKWLQQRKSCPLDSQPVLCHLFNKTRPPEVHDWHHTYARTWCEVYWYAVGSGFTVTLRFKNAPGGTSQCEDALLQLASTKPPTLYGTPSRVTMDSGVSARRSEESPVSSKCDVKSHVACFFLFSCHIYLFWSFWIKTRWRQ